MRVRPLTVALDMPRQYRSAVLWAVRHAANAFGIPVEVWADGSGGPPDIVHSSSGLSEPLRWWPFNPRCYDGDGEFAAREFDGHMIWTDGSPLTDLVGGIFRLLTFRDEATVDPGERNELGVFNTPALPPARRAVLQRPLVEHHLDALWARLHQVRPDLQQRPRWPNAKRWACVLTHDTDAVSLGTPRELLYNAAKLVVRRDRRRVAMLRAGVRHRGKPMTDPYFGFPVWRSLEEEWGIRSAFYAFVRPKEIKRHMHDSRSAVTDRGVDRGPLREMADAGWEFGLHASIRARQHPDGLRRSREMLEEILARPVPGLRHHYWAIDWVAPWRTFRQHAEAGFAYDTSIAWRDVPGFRAGSSLPFRPFDVDAGAPISLWELPTAIQDGHLLERSDPERAVEDAIRIIDEVRSRGGALVLNWHTESATSRFERAGYREALERLLELIWDRSDAWVTTPSRLLEHWQERENHADRQDVDL